MQDARTEVPEAVPVAATGSADLLGAPEIPLAADPDPLPADDAVSPSRSDPPAAPALSIAGVARGLGVATATLRSWERRYGLAPSLHTPGGHRRYGSADLARLHVMHRLVRSGVPAAEAARVAINASVADLTEGSGPFAALLWGERPHATQSHALPDLADPVVGTPDPSAAAAAVPGGPMAGGGLIEAPASGALTPAPASPARPGAPPPAPTETPPPDVWPPAGAAEDADPVGQPSSRHGSPGGGRILSMRHQVTPVVRGLARAAMALDAASCEGILGSALAERGTVETWDEVVRPVLAAIGRRWELTETGVEIEHSFSTIVEGGLARQAVLRGRPRNDSPVLLAALADEQHDLPLRALHAALAERGVRAHLLGARTPDEALADAVRRLGPPVVVLWAQMSRDELPALPVMRPEPALIVGGPGLPAVAASRLQADSLTEAIELVVAALGL